MYILSHLIHLSFIKYMYIHDTCKCECSEWVWSESGCGYLQSISVWSGSSPVGHEAIQSPCSVSKQDTQTSHINVLT